MKYWMNFISLRYYGTGRWWLFDLVYQNLYWRNTKESIKDQYQLPTLTEDLVLLNLTDFEKTLYADCDGKPGFYYLVPLLFLLIFFFETNRGAAKCVHTRNSV